MSSGGRNVNISASKVRGVHAMGALAPAMGRSTLSSRLCVGLSRFLSPEMQMVCKCPTRRAWGL
jgi:hypothetical protein